MDGLRYSPDDPYYRLGPVHTRLYVRACRLVTGTPSGRAASGGAIAPQPPRATRPTPEYIRNFPIHTFCREDPTSALPLGLMSTFVNKTDFSRLKWTFAKKN